MRLRVITSCTAAKAVDTPNKLLADDFAADEPERSDRARELAPLALAAEQMYSGDQHRQLMRGVRYFRDTSVGELDVFIVSAGYGLVRGDQCIVPYECTFNGMGRRALRDWADRLNLPATFQATVAASFDLGLILLGDRYLRACDVRADVEPGGPTIIICSQAWQQRLRGNPLIIPVVITPSNTREFSRSMIGLKGEIARRMLYLLGDDPTTLERLTDRDTDILTMLAR